MVSLTFKCCTGAANKNSTGDEVNVFSLETRPSRRIEDVQETLLSWQHMMEAQIAEAEARVAVLIKTAQTAPSVNSKIINLGSNVIFHNAEIEFVETFRVRDQFSYLRDFLTNVSLQSILLNPVRYGN